VCGSPTTDARKLWDAAALPGRFIELPSRGGDWGHTERNHVLASGLIHTSHVHHLDDDDTLAPGAGVAIRKAIRSEPKRIHIFRMLFAGRPIPEEGRPIEVGNVGTPCIVHPAAAPRGLFAPAYGGDGAFIVATCAANGGYVLHEDVIVRVRE